MKRILISILLIIVLPLAAADISLSLDQNEYYFNTGEPAIISLHTNNTYNKTLNGMLSYTITQEINQGGFQYSSSNTKSASFPIDKGKSTVSLDFGSSNSPITLAVAMDYSYTETEPREVRLEPIKIHFIGNSTQKQSPQNKVSSSSQKAQSQFAKQSQQMQQLMNQMMGNQQAQQQPPEQRLQNNQLSQDSSALKQQMQKQLQAQQQMKQQFQKSLAQNEEFQREHQQLLNQGYNLTNANLNPTSNNSGEFELNYQNKSGAQASLKGSMQDGRLQSLLKDSPTIRQQMLDKLQQNKEFQKYQQGLQEKGYAQQNAEFSQSVNKTEIKVNFKNKQNETAAIKAEIINNTVKNVSSAEKKSKNSRSFWWLLVLLAIPLAYWAHAKKKTKTEAPKQIKEPPFDYKAAALSLLSEANEHFIKKEHKEAYGKAGQALRLFLSYENKLNKELTNDEILYYLKKHKKPYKEARQCFNLCSLVEFAKYEANKKDFNKILEFAKQVIKA